MVRCFEETHCSCVPSTYISSMTCKIVLTHWERHLCYGWLHDWNALISIHQQQVAKYHLGRYRRLNIFMARAGYNSWRYKPYRDGDVCLLVTSYFGEMLKLLYKFAQWVFATLARLVSGNLVCHIERTSIPLQNIHAQLMLPTIT